MPSDFDADKINWADVQERWEIEPELEKSPPRRMVSRAPKAGCGARIGAPFLGCALLGMFALGLFLSLWAGMALIILPFGSTTTGKITRHENTSGRGARINDSESYLLYFEFAPHEKSAKYRGEWPVGGQMFTRLRDGDDAKVRYFPLAPGLRPLLEEGVSPWLHILFLGPMGLLLLVIGGLPLLGMLPVERADKRLVARGAATAGVIVKAEFGRVTFCFRVVSATGETRTIEIRQSVSANDQMRIEVGAVATVLFDTRRPNRAVIYRLCGWRAR